MHGTIFLPIFALAFSVIFAEDQSQDVAVNEDLKAVYPVQKRLHNLSLLRMNKLANIRSDMDAPIYPMEKRLHSLALLRMSKFNRDAAQDSGDLIGYHIQKRLHNLSLLRMNKFARPNIPEAKRRFFEDFAYEA